MILENENELEKIKNKMEHKAFRIFSFIILLTVISFAITYNYLSIFYNDFHGKFVLKLVPTFCIISIPLFYYLFYRITIYSLLIHLTLFFCLFGDIFLGLYDPNSAELAQYKDVYLMLGGGSFLIARFLILVAMIIYPSTRVKLIRYHPISLILSHILFNIPFLVLSFVFFLDRGKVTFIYTFIMIYIILGFGLQLSYSFLRIKAIEWEFHPSSIFAFIGVLLFNISDFLLLSTMFTIYFPSYCILIADNTYWLAIFLLSISIIRSNTTLEEKGKTLNKFNFENI